MELEILHFNRFHMMSLLTTLWVSKDIETVKSLRDDLHEVRCWSPPHKSDIKKLVKGLKK